jgi:[protein-PII] uridylyltransferase
MPKVSLQRGPLLDDSTLTGGAWCRAYARLVDGWLADLLGEATGGSLDRVALVAVGGFGRSELCPQSDIDVYLVHARRDISAVADRIWYPVWDEDLHLGHSVCTVREALRLGAEDLDTATALLSARHVAGDESLTRELAKAASDQWARRSKRWLAELGAGVALRHEGAGEVAFALEPDLKEGRGGLRDVHALAWAEAAHRILLEHDDVTLTHAYSVLLDARVELQRRTGRPSNVLALEDQGDVARALGDADPDTLMARVAEAARTIAWTSDDSWRRIRSSLRGPLGRLSRRNRVVDQHIQLRDGEVWVTDDAPVGDLGLVLRAGRAAATNRTVIERQSLERLAAVPVLPPDRWSDEDRAVFVDLLLCGPGAVKVIEALDQRGVWARVLPEWQPVRARPQRNPYHRYTVDRHLLETVAIAARLAHRVARPDLLVVSALLHDIGKGHGGDHTEIGVALTGRIVDRMGFAPDDAATIVALVAQHLLLADVATRRDLDDPTTIDRVATAVASVDRLHLLSALTEADSLATGPSAWGAWKAELVARLVDRVTDRLAGERAVTPVDAFPNDDLSARLALGADVIEVAGDTLTVMTADRPGVFSRIAGVLSLHGLDVVSAAAHSTEQGRALAQFRVSDPVRDDVPWDRVTGDLERAFGGRLALGSRLAERAQTYRRQRPRVPAVPGAWVSFDVDASFDATVIDVQTPDGIGVLYRITRAMAELDLDIRSARVQTLGANVVDAFYVRDAAGDKITDARVLAEIERAILHSLDA